MRRSLVVAGAVVGLAVAFALSAMLLASPSTQRIDPSPDDDPQIYRLEGYESGVYPFTNTRPSFAPYSPLNVIVRGSTDEVVTALTERSQTEWNRTALNQTDADEDAFGARQVNMSGTTITWGEAGGATRWAYVHNGTHGTWVKETDQLHDGTYFGSRLHIRLYESPNETEPWVAMQVHSEHFDWFTLRHAVDGVEDAQRQVEADFMNQPWVDRVYRDFLANDGPSDADGWTTIVELAIALPAILPVAAAGSKGLGRLWDRLTPLDRHRVRAAASRLTPRVATLAGAVAGLVFLVRGGGIVLEHYATFMSPFAIAGTLYPVLAFGIPLATYAIAHGMERRIDAALTASVALAAAILGDYAIIGVDVLGFELIAHRFGLVVALGLIAGGAARRATREKHINDLLLGGGMLWVGLLVTTLVGWI